MDGCKAPNIVLVGDPQVGKSTIISKCHEANPTLGEKEFFTTRFEFPTKYEPTSFRTYHTNIRTFGYHWQYIKNSVYQTNIIDTGGSTRYDEIRPLAYINSDVFLLCFDLTNSASLKSVESKWLPEIRQYEPHKPIILLGNKADLKKERQVIGTEAHKLSKTLGLDRYIEVSCHDDTNISMLFGSAVDLAVGDRQTLELINKANEVESEQEEEFDITDLNRASNPPNYPKKGSTTLCEDWQASLNSDSLTDIILRFPDGSPDINAHKFILTLASGAFKTLLTNMTSPKKNFCERSSTPNNTQHKDTAFSAQGTAIYQSSSNILLDGLPFSEIQHRQELDMNCLTQAINTPCRDKLKITFDVSINYNAFVCVFKWMYTGLLDIPFGLIEDSFSKCLYQTVFALEIHPLKVLCCRLFKPKRQVTGNFNLNQEHVVPLLQPHKNSDQEPQLNDFNIPATPPLELFQKYISKKKNQSMVTAYTNHKTKARNFANDARNAYQEMWRTADDNDCYGCLTDTVFVVQDTPIPIHRVVMVTRSPVLAAMLDGSFKERHLREIKLPGISLGHFQTVLEFMYTDKCLLDETNVHGVLELADRFCIQSLVDRCEEFLIFTCDKATTHPAEQVDAIMESINLSKVYNALFLYKWCLHFIATNYYFLGGKVDSVSAGGLSIAQSQSEQQIRHPTKQLCLEINLREDFQTVWNEVEEFMEKNRFPARKYLKILDNYKMKSRQKKTACFSKKLKIPDNSKCCVM